MTQLNFIPGIIFHMDNLVVLRGMNAETVALITTDPPFNIRSSLIGDARKGKANE